MVKTSIFKTVKKFFDTYKDASTVAQIASFVAKELFSNTKGAVDEMSVVWYVQRNVSWILGNTKEEKRNWKKLDGKNRHKPIYQAIK